LAHSFTRCTLENLIWYFPFKNSTIILFSTSTTSCSNYSWGHCWVLGCWGAQHSEHSLNPGASVPSRCIPIYKSSQCYQGASIQEQEGPGPPTPKYRVITVGHWIQSPQTVLVSNGSVHGCLVPCTWTEHHGSRSLPQRLFFTSWWTGSRAYL
jgi:hypothetical protein